MVGFTFALPTLRLLFTNEEYPCEAVSAVKALAIASAEGQRIYQVTQENVNAVLPVLNISSEVKDEIRASVAIGKVATVSQNNITVGSWTGVGYIIADPDTGAGAYRISGGSNGAAYKSGFATGTMAGVVILGFMVELTTPLNPIGPSALPLLGAAIEGLLIAMIASLAFLAVLTTLSDNPEMVAGCYFSGFMLGLDAAFIVGSLALKGWREMVAAVLALIELFLLVDIGSKLPSQEECLK